MADEIIATIETLNRKLADALRKRDFAAVGAMYTNDAMMLPPASNIVIGKGNIQSFWEQRPRPLQDVKFATLHVKQLGDGAAVEVGTFRMQISPASNPLAGEATEQGALQSRGISAKYVFVWQKVDGEWKIGTSSWNRIGVGPGGRLNRA
jgi:ketosteroid isomerase-like protein